MNVEHAIRCVIEIQKLPQTEALSQPSQTSNIELFEKIVLLIGILC